MARQTFNPLTRQRGLALITAMLVVAIAATTAAYLSLNQQIWLRQVQNLTDRAQAEVVRAGAQEWAITILLKDAKDSQSDDLEENWAKPLPALAVEGGQVVGRIADAQGRFNLNNLVQGGAPHQPSVALFRELLQSQSLDTNLVDAVIDWIDDDPNTQSAGAEDIDYLQMTVPYRAANRPMESIEELRLVRGFEPEVVDKLRPLVTALPQSTAINVNTASKEVLGALFYTLDAAVIERLIEQRPYKEKSAVDAKLQELAAGKALPPNLPSYGTQSSYFELMIETQFGRYQRTTEALILRSTGAEGTRALWHSQRLLVRFTDPDTAADKKPDTISDGNI